MKTVGGGLFGATNQNQLEASFKEFCSRPENQPFVEAAQKEELQQAVKLQHKVRWLEFAEQVAASGCEVQENLAPFMKHSVLRRILQTFANDTSQGLSAWACNPRVLHMLHNAKRLLEEGSMKEKELEEIILMQLKDPRNPANESFKQHTQTKVKLPADQLVSALNEHLAERQRGNAAYHAGRYDEAECCYQRALAVVKFVEGNNSSDQDEVDANKVAVLSNLAAVALAQQRYGAAISHCTEVLKVNPNSVLAYVRRAKAHIAHGVYQEAEADLAAAEELEPFNADMAKLRTRISTLKLTDTQKDRQLYAKMLSAS